MFSNKFFRVALLISVITHTTIFLRLPLLNFLHSQRTPDQAEVSYISEKNQPAPLKLLEEEFPQKPSTQAFSQSVAPPPQLKKEQIFQKLKSIPINKPELPKSEIIAVKKKITLPALSDEKINNPAYLNYYQIIREKIKRAAYHNYTNLLNGEVYLSFTILRDGQLRFVRIDQEKSTAQGYLKEIAEKSIHDAAPFSDFPPDLNYPELSFNVVISFEVE